MTIGDEKHICFLDFGFPASITRGGTGGARWDTVEGKNPREDMVLWGIWANVGIYEE